MSPGRSALSKTSSQRSRPRSSASSRSTVSAPVGPGGGPSRAASPPAGDPASAAPGPAELLAGMLSPQAIGSLLADAEAAGTAIDGPDGLLARMIKAVLERALDVEIADHL